MINLKLAMAMIGGVAMLLLVGSRAQAQLENLAIAHASEKNQANNQKQPTRQMRTSKPGQTRAGAQTPATRAALDQATKSEIAKKPHQLILQVNSNDPATMNLVLNNATNVAEYYHDLGEAVSIEVVTFGPGLHMLRDDTSPVKPRIEVLAMSHPEISFKACGNTRENMRKAENKDISLIPQATVVKSGVVRVMELQEQGWTYVKP